VPPHGVTLLRVHPTHQAVRDAAPSVTLGLDWAPAASDSTTRTVTATLTDNGSRPVTDAALALSGPAGATISTTSPTRARILPPGGALRATYTVTLKPSDELFAPSDFQGTGSSRFGPATTHLAVGDTVTVNHQVGAPYKTYASTTASFSQSGTR